MRLCCVGLRNLGNNMSIQFLNLQRPKRRTGASVRQLFSVPQGYEDERGFHYGAESEPFGLEAPPAPEKSFAVLRWAVALLLIVVFAVNLWVAFHMRSAWRALFMAVALVAIWNAVVVVIVRDRR